MENNKNKQGEKPESVQKTYVVNEEYDYQDKTHLKYLFSASFWKNLTIPLSDEMQESLMCLGGFVAVVSLCFAMAVVVFVGLCEYLRSS